MSTNTAKLIVENPNETLDRQIDETRRFIRHIDFSLSFFSLLTILLAVLFAAILADHWLFTNGLSMSLRIGVFFVLIFIIVFYVYRRIVPLLLYPINPVYAASLLEESSPSLKNSIVNWILLRKERLEQKNRNNDKLSERMFDGVTQTAMSSVKVISSERAVDLRNVTRWGIALTLCFLFFVIYATFSPKSPLTSLTRIILPISNIEKPQAVRFLNIEPGNIVALQGEKLTISAEIVSRSNEPVYLFFSTDDGQAVRQAIPMSLPEGKTRYEVPFPPGKQGFASSVDYWIAQNNSRSGTFRIDVRPTASIEIVSLKYRFPHYTGLPEETVENSSDIRAVEGTEVKIGVRSTIPLQRIDLVFDNDPLRTVGMKIADKKTTEATATITLKLDPQRTTPTTIRNFSFRATDQDGYESRRSGVFRIEVLPDQPPMVQWADTDTRLKDVAQFELPLNNSLELPIQAEDRDFGLRYLRFHVESGNKQIRPVELLESPATGATEHKGSIQRKTVFSPITSRLAEGDTAEIWAEAVDTKFPDPNNATTRRITVQIVAPKKQEQPPKENEKEPDDKKEKQEQKEEEQQNPQQNNGEQSEGQQENKSQESEKNQNQQGNADNQEQNNNSSEKSENNGESTENGDKSEEKTGEKNEQQKSEDSRNDQKGGEQTKEPTQQENSNTSDSPNSDENSTGKNNDQNNSNQNSPNKEHSEQKNSSSNNNSSDNGEQGKQNGKENQSQPVQEEQSDSSQKGDRQNNASKKPINPETQDGDAMEEILKQMKKEGKFDDKKLNEKKDDNNNDNQNNNNQNPNNQNPDQKNNEQNREQQNGSEQNQNGAENQTGSKSADSAPNSQPEQQRQSEQNSEQQSAAKQNESDSEQNNSNKNDTKNDEQTNGSNGKNRQNDSSSESSGNQGNNPKSEQQSQDIPVDPADKTPRQRDDSLDPNSTERSNQGGDSSNPKKSDVDRSHDSVTESNNEKGQETNQQGRSDQTQSTEQGKSGNKNENGVEKQNGLEEKGNKETGEKQNSATKNNQSDGGKQKTESSNNSESGESGNSSPNNSDQDNSDCSGLPEGKNSATGKKPSDKPQQNSASENNTDDQNSTNNKNNTENSTENNQSQHSPSGTENNPSSSADSGNQSNPTGGQGQSALNVETPVEDPNLEYSKKITNLVLEYLEDQLKSKPSQELLDNLGWTEKELRDFHRKWREMSEQSKRSELPTTNDDAKWREAFKSLGLKPAQNRQQLQKSRNGVQDENKVTESQHFTPPPA
ncbi:MAG: hypothetical protein LBC02_12510, partial [Planctomycetaceae bacterium]|nr:hypothetical protein [Planctomycetaceae bacterium]